MPQWRQDTFYGPIMQRMMDRYKKDKGPVYDKEKYSYRPANQDQKPAGYTTRTEYAGAGDGRISRQVRTPFYGRVSAQNEAPIAPTDDPTPDPQPAPGTQEQTYLPVPTYEAPSGPNMEDLASQFAASIANMQSSLMESFAAQQENFMQMQMAQDEKMQKLMSNIAQATAAQQDRPAVAGVKTAVGSSGDQMQIARRGVSGNFGRLGLRIKNLNV